MQNRTQPASRAKPSPPLHTPQEKRTLVKKIVMTVVAVAAAVGLAGCPAPKKHDPCKPNGCTASLPKDKTSDGIWNVGDELRPGLWSLDKSWADKKKYPNCAWFVSPATATASATAEPTSEQHATDPGSVTIRLHEDEHLTSSGCPDWERVGD